ncbi:MAG: hypothetical protein K0A98_03695 [Trueperaceae bacterium]|nr:hypothetical protein [Trueperaceae bacterium]
MNRPFARLLALAALLASSAALAMQPLASPIYYLVTAPELVDGAPVIGELTTASGRNFKDGSHLDVLVLRSAGQETVDVRVESDDFDVYLTLVSPAGEVLDANDYVQPTGGAFDAARVRTYLPEAGAYLVVVSGYGPNDLGRYTVTRSRFVAPPKVVVDVEVPGRYDGYLAEMAADMLWITLEAPATVVADLRSGDFDTILEVYDGRGRFVDANDDFDGTDSRLVLDLEPGRYEFLVKGYWDDADGAYAFTVDFYQRPPRVEVGVDAPGVFEGLLTMDAVDTYVLHLDAAATVTVDLRSNDFDAYLEAYDADLDWIDANDDFEGSDARLVLDLEAGTYLFEASSFWSADAGAYTIAFDW